MITENGLQELLRRLPGEDDRLRAVAHAMNLLERHSGITESLIVSYVDVGVEEARKEVPQYHLEALNPLFYHQTVSSRLKGRLRREAVDVSRLDVIGKQGEVTDLHNVYIYITNKQQDGEYIESNPNIRREYLIQVENLISLHHWSLGREQSQSREDKLVYYWPSNCYQIKAS